MEPTADAKGCDPGVKMQEQDHIHPSSMNLFVDVWGVGGSNGREVFLNEGRDPRPPGKLRSTFCDTLVFSILSIQASGNA